MNFCAILAALLLELGLTGSTVSPTTLYVYNRPIPIAEQTSSIAAHGRTAPERIARFRFSELCETVSDV